MVENALVRCLRDLMTDRLMRRCGCRFFYLGTAMLIWMSFSTKVASECSMLKLESLDWNPGALAPAILLLLFDVIDRSFLERSVGDFGALAKVRRSKFGLNSGFGACDSLLTRDEFAWRAPLDFLGRGCFSAARLAKV